ncbi:hypothetical protein FACS1894202_00650 [Clostridia bacterium]|nr:hypothetical protein FACS1894202_00650 [Clostridia bacterium]
MTDMQYLGVIAMIKAVIKAEIEAGKSAEEILASIEELEKALKTVKKEEQPRT